MKDAQKLNNQIGLTNSRCTRKQEKSLAKEIHIAVKQKDGTVAIELTEVKDKWNEYIRELFADKREESKDREIDEGPDIMKEEIEAALIMI